MIGAERLAAIDNAKTKLRRTLIALEGDLGVVDAWPVTEKIAEAMQTCDEIAQAEVQPIAGKYGASDARTP